MKLTVLRGPEDEKEGPWESKEFTLGRGDIVKIESVQYWMLDSNIAYLRIIEFTGRTAEDVSDALKELRPADCR